MTFLYWAPRIIGILAIMFISLFAADSFDSDLTFWQQIVGFLIHLIPSIILSAFLFIAWKWELIGGAIFTIIGIVLSPIVFMRNYEINNSLSTSLGIILMITFPFIVIGILFMIHHFAKRKISPSSRQ